MKLHQYYAEVSKRQAKTNERKGQAAFNVLYAVRSELALKISGSDIDPFYDDYLNADFLTFLTNEWGK